MWPFKSKEEKQRLEETQAACDQFVVAASSASPEGARRLAEQFTFEGTLDRVSQREARSYADSAFVAYCGHVLADDHLTAEEEEAFGHVSEALGISQEVLQQDFAEVVSRLVVARVNNGRLLPMVSHQLMAKKDETVYLEIGAGLMKEVSIREWQGGSGGFSFRVAKGVRYNVGRTKGRSVVVGTEVQMADVGLLAVSSSRIAFLGERKTMEFPLAKLMDIDVYEDGVRIHSSHRQTAPLFQLQAHTADVFAATVNAAVQTLDE